MMPGIIGSFVCSVVILALSFFVLLASRKVDSQWTKIFGYVVTVLLWISAALIFGGGFRGCPGYMLNAGMKKMPPMYDKMLRGDKPAPQEMRGGMGSLDRGSLPQEGSKDR